MLLSAVSVLVVAQSSSEIPEGLMNNPVQKSVITKTPSFTVGKKFIAIKKKIWDAYKNENISCLHSRHMERGNSIPKMT